MKSPEARALRRRLIRAAWCTAKGPGSEITRRQVRFVEAEKANRRRIVWKR